MSSCVEEDFIFGLDLGHHSLTHAHAIVGRGRGRHVRVQHVLCVHRRLLGLVLKEERVIGRRAVPVYEVDDEVALLDLRAAVVRPVVHRLVRRLRRLALSSKFLYTATVCITTAFFCDIRKDLRATSAMMDVPTDEQELPEPVKLRAICEVPDEWEKLGRIRHQRTT